MAKESKYEEFDVALLESIMCGNNTFMALCNEMRTQADPFASDPREYWRVIDRRLQAMRKMGHCSVRRQGLHSIWSVHV